ncbi:MAG: hypothetical protein IJU91_00445, partial [Selenomonadaceae bacterium]|nr:hypothetical protein [Selenomonadaceae bacterium]
MKNFYSNKKSFFGICILACVLLMAGCGSTSENQSANQREDTIFDNKAEVFIGSLKLFAAQGNFDL